jgi:hypothetical protein
VITFEYQHPNLPVILKLEAIHVGFTTQLLGQIAEKSKQ